MVSRQEFDIPCRIFFFVIGKVQRKIAIVGIQTCLDTERIKLGSVSCRDAWDWFGFERVYGAGGFVSALIGDCPQLILLLAKKST